MFSRPKPDEVFTPRSPTINKRIYVDRSELESRLESLLRGTKHIVVHGESGNGKSWLYKRVFERSKTAFSVINLANASRFAGIGNAIQDKILKSNDSGQELSQVVLNREGGISPAGVGVKVSDQKIYDIAKKDPLEAIMQLLRRDAGRHPAVLVFDNFEMILNHEALVDELSNILILLDDEDYARFHVRIMIVGVPAELREYLTKQGSLQSLSNRLAEAPEVARLTVNQAKELLTKGFLDLLKIRVDDESGIFDRILWTTDRIAQHLHELCLECAMLCVDRDSSLTHDILSEAERLWFNSSISTVRQVIDINMNARETKAGRRNQVIWALGCIKTEDFKYTDVENVVRSEFSESTEDVALNIIQRLGELEKSAHPIIKRVPKGDAYRIINPKVKIAIRIMLRKENGRVEKLPHLT